MTGNKKRAVRYYAVIFVSFILCAIATGCSAGKDGAEPKEQISVAALKGPTAMGMASLMEQNREGKTFSDYTFTIAGSADEITAGILKGEYQIASVPCNLASVLYNKSDGALQVAAVNTTCVLYVVEDGESIQSVSDLKGKTILSTGKGTTPEYTLRYLLTMAGLNPDTDVKVEYKSEATEVAALLAEGSESVAMLPQPFVTVAMAENESLRIALDVAKEWENYSNGESSAVTGVVLVNRDFAKEHTEEWNAFLREYEASVEYVNTHVEEASLFMEQYGIVKAEIAKKAIPYCNLVFQTGEEMKEKISSYLSVLYEQEPKSIGGKLPKDDFYRLINEIE